MNTQLREKLLLYPGRNKPHINVLEVVGNWFIVLFFLLPISISAQITDAVSFDNQPLKVVLADLEKRYDVVFSYTSDITKGKHVSIDSDKLSISGLLDEILTPLYLQYNSVNNNYFVITELETETIKLCAEFTDEEGEHLPFVNIYLPSIGIGTSGDVDGKLDWTQDLIGNESVVISYIGYENVTTDVSYLESCPQIVLKIKQFSFDEVIVKDFVTAGIEQSKEMDHMILDPSKINMVPGLTDSDVLQAVQLLPGVESIDESATGLHVRGGTPDQNLILYDGIPIYNGGHFFGMISAFNPSLVHKIDVYRSGFGPKFGGRVASVIDIHSVNSIPDKLNIDAGINFTHGDIALVAPIVKNRVGLVLGARKSYTDIIETPTYQKLSERVFRKGKLDEVQEEDPEVIDFGLAFDFNDYNAKLLIDPTDRDKIAFSFFQIDDNLDFDYNDTEDNFSTKDNIVQKSTGFGFRWERAFNSSWTSRINISQTDFSNDYKLSILDGDSDEPDTEDSQFNKVEDKTITWDNTLSVSDAIAIDFGGQYADLFVERSWQFEEGEEGIDRQTDSNKILTGYLSINSKFKNKLTSKLGLRWNHDNARRNYFEPRLSLQYFPLNYLQLKASAGYYRQFMSQVVEFNDLGINQDFWVLSDDEESIPVAGSKNFLLGLIYHPKSMIVEIEGYYKYLDGLTSNLSGFTIEMDEEFEFGSGKSWGIDVLVKKKWNKFNSWISYSFGRTQYSVDLDDEFLSLNAPHDRPHSFSFINQYQNKNWNFSVSWKIASGLVYTEANGLSNEGEDSEPIFDLMEINNQRLPISHRLDFSLMYSVIKSKGVTGKLGLSLLNIYNNENIMSREYFSIYDEEEEFYELQARDREMLRFTPNLVMRISFD